MGIRRSILLFTLEAIVFVYICRNCFNLLFFLFALKLLYKMNDEV